MTVLSHLQQLASDKPDAIAILEPSGPGSDASGSPSGNPPAERAPAAGRPSEGDLAPVTRAELLDETLRLRRELHELGFGAGDCAAIWLPNWTSALAWQVAVGSLGGHVIGINTRYNVHEVTHVLTLARPKVVVIAHDFVGLDLIGRLRESVEHAAHEERWQPPVVFPVSAPGAPEVTDLDGYDVGAGARRPAALGAASGIGEPLSTSELPEPAGDHLYIAFTTSGSTGLPKLAAHKEAATLEQILAASRVIGAREGDRLLAALPFSGTFGFIAAFAMLLAGGTLVMHPSFKPDETVRRIEQEGVTQLAFGDDMMTRVVEAAADADLTSLRWAGIADFQGAARPLAEWLESHTGAHVTGLYGSSETFALLNSSGADVPAPERWLPGGRLTPDSLEYRIADGEQVITDGSEGEIQFRGPQAVDDYLGQPQKMAENFTSDGWFRSGDLGRALDDRSFRYVCRAAEALRLKGFLVEPDEIGNFIATHEAVDIAKVVGVRRAHEDEAVGFVTLKPGAQVSGDELVDYCRHELARYKVPVAIYVIDEMPVTAGTNGTKIRANVLKEWALDRLS